MHGMCQYREAPAAQRRPRNDLDLSAYAVAAGRLQLPAPADMFGLWRRGDRTFRIMGRGLDDAGADLTLPALGNFGHRQRAAEETSERAVVSAVALRTLARRQRLIHAHCCHARNFRFPPCVGLLLLGEETNNALENQPSRSRPPADRPAGGTSPARRDRC